uniref:Glucose-6-phosphate isomerase n=1 Tax=Macrostomum lignano TaxID=282301 RepID=A0A1I8F554_9PLAT
VCRLFFQQGDMESNGESVTSDGKRMAYNTGRLCGASPALMASTPSTSCCTRHPYGTGRLLSAVHTHNPISGGVHHQILLSNCLAQTQALAFGKTLAEAETELRKFWHDAVVAAIAAHKVFEGNRPTNSVLFNKLNPFTLGALIAMYEHKIFVQ